MSYKKLVKYDYFRQLSLFRKYRKTKEKKKERNKRKNSLRRSFETNRGRPVYQTIPEYTIHAGTAFSLLENPENVIRLVNEIDSFKIGDNKFKRILIDLSEITTIDIGSISFLLAKVHEMNRIGKIQIWGNMPKDKSCQQVFIDSGFLDYMRDLSGNKFERHGDNYLVNIGSDRTLNEKVGKSIQNSIKHLTTEKDHFPPVFSIVQEMCSNSVEHANTENIHKNWFLGVNCVKGSENQNPHIIFTMTDVGFGILKTIKRKFGTKIKELMENKTDWEILHRAFQKQYQSKTEEINRNRGLPRILDIKEKNYIKDLKVITNNVFLDFDNLDSSKILSKNLPGTFYYWKIDLNCIEIWNQVGTN
ncbi:MAG: hypothetical protein M0P47_12805 [Bacteroidales bacterium]|nr:hypothetical protein [Bacteroidales bacterium]